MHLYRLYSLRLGTSCIVKQLIDDTKAAIQELQSFGERKIAGIGAEFSYVVVTNATSSSAVNS
jgi:hypothetical protein